MQINSTNIQPQTTDYDLVGSSHMTIYVPCPRETIQLQSVRCPRETIQLQSVVEWSLSDNEHRL
jgi:hypothetical protein